jgi:hypothetical protein
MLFFLQVLNLHVIMDFDFGVVTHQNVSTFAISRLELLILNNVITCPRASAFALLQSSQSLIAS